MSATSIESARAFVRVLWDDSAVRRGIESTQAVLRSTAATVGKIGAGFTAGGAAILAPLTAAVFQFSEAGAAIDDMSARTGTSAEALSQLAYAADQSGASIDTVEKGIKKMSQTITAAKDGNQAAVDSLRMVGIAASELDGMSPDQQMIAIAEGLSKIKDPGERAARSMEVFGKAGSELLPLMNDGAKGIQNLMAEADSLGLTLTGDQAKAAADFDDAWSKLKSTLYGITMQIGAALAPTITDLIGRVVPFVSQVVQWIRANDGLIKGVGLLAIGIVAGGTALTVFAGILAAIATVIGVIVSPLGIIIGLVATLGITIVNSAGGATAALEMLKDAFPGLSGALGDTFNALKAALSSGEYKLAAQVLWLSLKTAWLTGIDALNQEWMLWKKAFLDTFNSALHYVQKEWMKLQNLLAQGTLSIMAFFDASINVDAAQQTLEEDFQRQLKSADAAAEANQKARDAAFESDISKVNQELEDARTAWREAVSQAAAVGEDRANDPSASKVADDKFTKLLAELQAGDIATRINDTVKASSSNVAKDVRTVGGAGQLTSLINRADVLNQQMLTALNLIASNTTGLQNLQPEVVNI